MEDGSLEKGVSEEILQNLKTGLLKTSKQSLKILCLNAKLTSTTTEISSTADDDEVRQSVTRRRIDRQLMTYLTQSDVINWTQQTCRLAPMKRNETTAGGDGGLLWSIVSAIWNVQEATTELELFIRRLVHVTLTSGRRNSSFQERWKLEQSDQSRSQIDWGEVCGIFKGEEISGIKDSIDPIHLFSISNILRRPILMVGDISTTSSSEETPNDLSGVYLPVLSSAENCVPYPLVLVRYEGVFCPLLIQMEAVERGRMMPFQAVPLVRFDQEPFHIRCLLESEQKRVHELMKSYLKIAEISRSPGIPGRRVLIARLSTKTVKMPNRIDTMGPHCSRNDTVRYLDSDEVRLEDKCPRNQGQVRHQFQEESIPESQDKTEKSKTTADRERQQLKVTSAYDDWTKCKTIECENKGSEKYGNQCHACYVRYDEEASGGEMEDKRQVTVNRNSSSNELGVCKHNHRSDDENITTAIKMETDKSGKAKTFIDDDLGKTTEDKMAIRSMEVSEIQLESDSIFDLDEVEKLRNTSYSTDKIRESIIKSEDDSTRSSKLISDFQAEKAISCGEECSKEEKETLIERNSNLEGDFEKDRRVKEPEKSKKCIMDFCENVGEKFSKGLCKVCYDTLVQHRLRKKEEKYNSDLHCLTEGCHETVANRQLRLCLSCLRHQIFAARDMERRRASCSSQRSSVSSCEGKHWMSSSVIDTGDRRSNSPKRRTLKSAGDVIDETTDDEMKIQHQKMKIQHQKTKIQQQKRPSLQGISSRNDRSRRCFTLNCDGFGDFSCHGFCRRCFEKFSESNGKGFALKH